ncbi:D-alanyl-D-alanine carboxypeptidase [Candidatus Daviesbacteria bacterium]|nr:D-alanyl-D-alanine carboxypeptidase [Candidatus Daviesbacteria bacterium]
MITTRSVRIFLIGLTLTFLMTVIPHLGFKQNKTIVSPLSKTTDIWDKITPKLELKQNSFQVKRQLISNVSAGGDYDKASAYAVVDFDSGEVLASKNLSAKMPMASLTKVMTAVVALDLAEPDEYFTVTRQAASQIPTKVMLKAGEQYRLEDLLQHALISSANDSSYAIKDGIDAKYRSGTFIAAMNKKAKFIGLKNTQFSNPAGLDSANHYSSVEDLAVLSAYALKNYPLISEIVALEISDLTNNGEDMRFYLQNWNGLMGVYPNISGVKIGNTGKAGNCTIVLSERNGKKIIAVVLGAPGVLERDLWASQLLDLGFSKAAGLEPIYITEDELQDKYASWQYFE